MRNPRKSKVSEKSGWSVMLHRHEIGRLNDSGCNPLGVRQLFSKRVCQRNDERGRQGRLSRCCAARFLSLFLDFSCLLLKQGSIDHHVVFRHKERVLLSCGMSGWPTDFFLRESFCGRRGCHGDIRNALRSRVCQLHRSDPATISTGLSRDQSAVEHLITCWHGSCRVSCQIIEMSPNLGAVQRFSRASVVPGDG